MLPLADRDQASLHTDGGLTYFLGGCKRANTNALQALSMEHFTNPNNSYSRKVAIYAHIATVNSNLCILH
jgi:hypothetical protein